MKNLIPHFIQERFLAGESHGQLEAAVMFIDISGFTALTNRLMERGAEGAEEMSLVLNRIFEPTVRLVYERGGFIPYFAGDAFEAIFPFENNEKAVETALATALDTLERFRKLSADDLLAEHQIGVKMALSTGEVEWGIVGKTVKSFYFRGDPIDSIGYAQGYAERFEIVADRVFLNRIFENQIPLEPVGEGMNFFKVPEHLPFSPPFFNEKGSKRPKLPAISDGVAAKFLPDPLIHANQPGEFRQVVTVLLSFEGATTHASLDRFSSVILDQIAGYQGYFKEIDFGDKGALIFCVFGAPTAFENNVERALEFIDAVREDLKNLSSLTGARYKIGLTNGLAFCGIVGGEERCQYAAVGARVNQAARLMQKAEWGEVWTDENVQRNRNFRFQHVGEFRFKGFSENLPTFRLIGRNLAGRTSFVGALVGRQKEVADLVEMGSALRENRFGGAAYIYGEAGIGKSRLSFEIKKALRERMAVSWFSCQSDQILRKPFNPFIYFLKNYFEQSPENSVDQNRERFDAGLRELIGELSNAPHPEATAFLREISRTQSVLAALVGLTTSGSLWDQLDARGRYSNAISAVQNLFLAEAVLQPVVIELEDAHWYDEMSREFLNDFLRRASNYPLFILVTSRYDDDGSKSSLFRAATLAENGIALKETDLNILGEESLGEFVTSRLGGKAELKLTELLQKMTNGNPFYVEQMIDYFRETGLLEEKNGLFSLKKDETVHIADSVKSIMMARIDRLSGLVKETVKAAAVIGREFEVPVLKEVLEQQEEFLLKNGNLGAVLKEQIQTAEKWQIWHAMNELRYIFKHALLRDAAYDMQLRARLRELHQQIAQAIERLYPKDEERFADLVFHYEQAEIGSKTIKYLEKAAAFARRNYQNRSAIAFSEKLVGHLRDRKSKNRKLARVLMRLGSVRELIGDWAAAQADYQESLELAKSFHDFELTGRANRRLGQVLMLKGEYAEARKRLETAVTCFELTADAPRIAKATGNLGTLFFRQGQYEDAKTAFSKAIELFNESHRLGEATPFVATLGLIFMNQGRYDEGVVALERQLDLLETSGDRQGLTTIFTNLGIIYLEKGSLDSALRCLERGLDLAEELGDKLSMTICTGCLGSVWEKKGDFEKAMSLFEKDLRLAQEMGDRQGTAIAHGLLGDLHSILGNFGEAIDHLQTNLEMSRQLGYKKGIAKALNTLGDTFFYQNQVEKSLAAYAEAIEVCREINNRLVLGYSLIELGFVHLLTENTAAAEPLLAEAMPLAEAVGNPDLLFGARILEAKFLISKGQKAEAETLLLDLLKNASDPREEAAVHYEIRGIASDGLDHRRQAFALYQVLFEESPQYLFRARREELEREV